MELFESLFDISYLIIVVGLGVRLLLEKDSGARLFGIMAVSLGLGDAFHLLPRVMSHLSPGGFDAYEAALSWGQFITSITMTIFYGLYYYYYKRASGKNIKSRDILVYVLAAARIGLTLLPQNAWGSMPGNYAMGIIRNVPFAILGVLLIVWSWQDRDKPGLKYMAELIFFSFLFYLPVVLWGHILPALGALMMPKTVAYLLLVIVGYKHFIREFEAINILKVSFVYLVMGLGAGVFYREFTKFNFFTDKSPLSVLHVHSIALGFVFLALVYIFLRDKKTSLVNESFKKPIFIFSGGLYFTLVTMTIRGISRVVGQGYIPFADAALSGIAGLAHIGLGIGIAWLALRLIKAEELVGA